jgi:hypothetical protein
MNKEEITVNELNIIPNDSHQIIEHIEPRQIIEHNELQQIIPHSFSTEYIQGGETDNDLLVDLPSYERVSFEKFFEAPTNEILPKYKLHDHKKIFLTREILSKIFIGIFRNASCGFTWYDIYVSEIVPHANSLELCRKLCIHIFYEFRHCKLFNDFNMCIIGLDELQLAFSGFNEPYVFIEWSYIETAQIKKFLGIHVNPVLQHTLMLTNRSAQNLMEKYVNQFQIAINKAISHGKSSVNIELQDKIRDFRRMFKLFPSDIVRLVTPQEINCKKKNQTELKLIIHYDRIQINALRFTLDDRIYHYLQTIGDRIVPKDILYKIYLWVKAQDRVQKEIYFTLNNSYETDSEFILTYLNYKLSELDQSLVKKIRMNFNKTHNLLSIVC